jgi:acetyl-CoA acetyltransferase
LAALDDAGVAPAEVDGIFRYSWQTTTEIEVARALGLENVRAFGCVDYGGGAGAPTVVLGAMAIETGIADVVVVWRARNRSSGGRPWLGPGANPDQNQFEHPFGLNRPVDAVAMLTRTWQQRYGWPEDGLGHIALTLRNHARRNPAALMQKPLTMADYCRARMIADPLRLFDCCLETDGALAMVLTSAERARDLDVVPAFITARAMGTGPRPLTMTSGFFSGDLGPTPSRAVARELWRSSDLRPEDIDVAQFYDAFTSEIAWCFEEYGFCGEGEVMDVLASGEHVPYNTSGGSLSEAYVHGFNLLVEGVRQIRGTSTSQVPDARHCLVTSGNTVPCGAVVLSKDPR